MNRQTTMFFVFLAIVAVAALTSSLFVPGEWYEALRKPSWYPPSWIFAPVWALLCLLITISAWLAWKRDHPLTPRALKWWLISLALNGIWSWLFFGLHRPGWALAEMGLLILTITITIRLFRRISKPAASLMTPYLLWICIAWVLNLTIWWLNGGGLESILS